MHPTTSLLGEDRDLAARVSAHLRNQHRLALRQLNIGARQGVVTVQGRVSTWHQKQICLACCRRVAGVYGVVDEVQVVVPPRNGATAAPHPQHAK